jgi:hypothetical protein
MAKKKMEESCNNNDNEFVFPFSGGIFIYPNIISINSYHKNSQKIFFFFFFFL